MSLQSQFEQDLKTAMRERDQFRVDVLRMGIAALRSAQMASVKAAFDQVGEAGADSVDSHQPLSDQAALDTITKEVRKRREAAEIYRKSKRPELADQEDQEAGILEAYLPKLMGADELRPLVAKLIGELGASGPNAIGKVMPVLMKEFKGRADGRVINQVARELLG